MRHNKFVPQAEYMEARNLKSGFTAPTIDPSEYPVVLPPLEAPTSIGGYSISDLSAVDQYNVNVLTGGLFTQSSSSSNSTSPTPSATIGSSTSFAPYDSTQDEYVSPKNDFTSGSSIKYITEQERLINEAQLQSSQSLLGSSSLPTP